MPLLIAHHVAVEILGHEYSPNTIFDHVCLFGILALLLSTSAYGTWTLGSKFLQARRRKAQVS